MKNLICLFLLLSTSLAQGKTEPCPQKLETKTVRGSSMLGLFKEGQDLNVDMNYYACHKPSRNDRVIVLKKGFPAPIIKSLLILPGDDFKLVGNVNQGAELFVNGKALENGVGQVFRFKGNAFKMLKIYEGDFKQKVPEDFFFVFGTQGNGSRDSSKFGPVQKNEILGKVLGLK